MIPNRRSAGRPTTALVLAPLLATAVAACSGGPPTGPTLLPKSAAPTASATPTASWSLTPAPSLSLRSVPPSASPVTSAPAVPAVTGYALSAAPAEMQTRFAKVAAASPQTFTGATVRTVRKSGAVLGTLAVLGLQPQLVGDAAVENEVAAGVVRGMAGKGVKVTMQSVSGTTVATATTTTTSLAAWYRGGTIGLVLGSVQPGTVLTFVKAYVGAGR